ncbi:MAG: hypothetical protein WAW02_00525 [Sideroxyarcus sp.]
MKFRTFRTWNFSSDLSSLLFFAQRMEELLFDYSLDTHKSTALNTVSLCNEALSLYSDIEAGVLDEANLTHVLDELEWAIQSDTIAKSLMEADLQRYLPRHEDTPLATKKLRLEVLAGALNPYRYFERCAASLEQAIVTNQKEDIDSLSRTLCTTLINLGQSKIFLYRSTLDYFFHEQQTITDCTHGFQGFIKKIYPFTHHFDIYFIVSKLIKSINEETDHFKIEPVTSLPAKLIEFANTKGFVAREDEVIIRAHNIQSFDVFSAREDAERRLCDVRDFFVLFYHKSQVTWRDDALVVQLCCEETPAIASKPKSSMEKGFDLEPAVASKRMNWLLRTINLSTGGSFERFDRVVELHGIGVSNQIPENQLLNLWISIETITPSHVGQNKIAGVISSLSPVLMLNYINRLVERVASDLVRWDRYRTAKILKKVSKDKNVRLNILRLLAMNKHAPLRDELYGMLGDFHLLRYRLFRLSRTLSDPNKIKDLLKTHEKKVSWQIRRIYRTRNLIVHSGQSPVFIHALIENGHDYLDQILTQIMLASCGDHHMSSLDQVFEFAKIRYERFEKDLNASTEFDNNNLTFLLGNAAFPPSKHSETWSAVRE